MKKIKKRPGWGRELCTAPAAAVESAPAAPGPRLPSGPVAGRQGASPRPPAAQSQAASPPPALDAPRAELKRRFPTKPWLDAFSKADLLEEELDEAAQRRAEAAAACGGGGGDLAAAAVADAVDFARVLPGALPVSSLTGEGVEGLKAAMVAMLEEAELGGPSGTGAGVEGRWAEAEAAAGVAEDSAAEDDWRDPSEQFYDRD